MSKPLTLTLKVYQLSGEIGFTIIDDGPDRLTGDIAFYANQYNRITFADWKAKLPSYWPKLESSGTIQCLGGEARSINDFGFMKDFVIPEENGQTETYTLTIKTSNAPEPAKPVERVTSRSYEPAPVAHPVPTFTSIPASSYDGLNMNVVIRLDSGKYHFDCTGTTATGFSHSQKFSISSGDYEEFKISAFKRELDDDEWPRWGRGGTYKEKDFYDYKPLQEYGIGIGTHLLNFKIQKDPTADLHKSPRTAETHPVVSPRSGAGVSPRSSTSYTPVQVERATSARAAPAATTPAAPTTPSKPVLGADEFILTITISSTPAYRFLNIHGVNNATHFDRHFDHKLPTDEFPNLTFGDIKNKFPDDWPRAAPGGVFVSSTYVDFSDSDTILSKGLRASNMDTRIYELNLKIDPNAKPVAHKVVEQEKPKVAAIPADRLFKVEVRGFSDSSQATLICSSHHPDLYHYNEINFPTSDMKTITLEKFKSTLSSKGWPAVKSGAVCSQEAFSDYDTLFKMGIIVDSHPTSYFMEFELNPKAAAPVTPVAIPPVQTTPTPQASTSPRYKYQSQTSLSPRRQETPAAAPVQKAASSTYSPTPHSNYSAPAVTTPPPARVAPASDVFILEVTISCTPQYRFLNVHGVNSATHFDRHFDHKLTTDEFLNFTFGDLKKKFPSDWPGTKPGGVFLSSSYVDFSDSDTILSKGLRASNMDTRNYELHLKIDPNAKPTVQAAAPVAAKVVSIPADRLFKVELRTYLDGDNAVLICSSQHPDLYHYNELQYPEYRVKDLTIAQFRQALKDKGWPETKPGGINCKEGYSDSDPFSTVGIWVDSRPTSYVLDLELAQDPKAIKAARDAPAPTPAPVSTPAAQPTSLQSPNAARASSRVEPTPAPVTPTKRVPPKDTLMIDITLSMNSQYRFLSVNGVNTATNFDRKTEIKLSADEYANFTFADFKNKLPTDWPRTHPGGVFFSSTYVDFSDRETLLSKGLRGNMMETRNYELELKIDPNAKPVAAAPVAAAQPKAAAIPEALRLGVELRMYEFGDTVNIIASSQHPDLYHYNELNFSSSEMRTLTFKQLRETLVGKGWPTTRPGGIHAKESFNDSDTLFSVGISADSRAASYFIDLQLRNDPKAPKEAEPAPSFTSAPSGGLSPRGPSVTKRAPTKDILTLDITLSQNSSYRFLNVHGVNSATHFDSHVELKMTADEYSSFTFGELKSKLPSHWPRLLSGGQFLSTTYVDFSDRETLLSKGLRGNMMETRNYELEVKIDPNARSSAPQPTTTKPALVEIPKERRFGVEMRLYNDRSQVTIICSSQHPDLYHYNELNISASEWKNYTIAAFKKALQAKGWPATKPGGVRAGAAFSESATFDSLEIIATQSTSHEVIQFELLSAPTALPPIQPTYEAPSRTLSGGKTTTPAPAPTPTPAKPAAAPASGADSKFCEQCGTKASSMATRFCGGCGAKYF